MAFRRAMDFEPIATKVWSSGGDPQDSKGRTLWVRDVVGAMAAGPRICMASDPKRSVNDLEQGGY